MKGFFDIIESKPMGGHRSRIDTLGFQQSQQAAHAFKSSGTQCRANGFIAHAHSPSHSRDAHVFSITVVSNIGNRPAGPGDFYTGFKRRLRPQRLDRGIHPYPIRQI